MDKFEEIFTPAVRKSWNEWQIDFLVLLSLYMQMFLILCGSRRKYIAKPWISVIVWLAYLSSDWVATVALGNLSSSFGDCKKSSSPNANGDVIIRSLWVPILLLHLGGPDTITALSLEDNDLWLRHFLGLVVQITVAIYVFIRSWSTSSLTFITIPLLIVSLIKYGDKTYVLRSSSTKKYKSSLLSSGGKLGQIGVMSDQVEDLFSEMSILFNSLEHLFAGLVLTHSQLRSCHLIICGKSPKEAFDLVANELSCLYDVLYTKATVAFSKPGILLRCIDSLACISALVAFFVTEKFPYATRDVAVTYLLLVGAVLMEVYTFAMIILSDSKRQLYMAKLFSTTTYSPPSNGKKYKKWSRRMAQFNLLNIYMPKRPSKRSWILNSLPLGEEMENNLRVAWTEVSDDLCDLIFKELQSKAQKIGQNDFDVTECKTFMAQRGDDVIKRWHYSNELRWATTDIEFDHSLLLWHIATDVCYFDDYGDSGKLDDKVDPGCRISKCLSDYMLYLLVIRPYMLPKGITDIRYRDTFTVAERIHKTKNITREKLIEIDFKKFMEDKDIRSRDKSVLFDGCRLAKQLKNSPELSHREKKWGLISQIWVEMLTFAAGHCGWKEHAQQLTTGGELLTHVCLLMAHLGFTEQYRYH